MTKTETVTRSAAASDLIDSAAAAASVISVTNTATGAPYPASTTSGYTVVNVGNAFSLLWAGAAQPPTGVQYTVIYNVHPGFILKGGDFVKAAFVAALRAAYTEQPFYDIYRYNSNDTLSKLSIYESFPKRPLKNPAIIVSTGPGDISRTILDHEDFLAEKLTGTTPTGMYAWGKYLIEAKVSILGITDRDRRKLTDLTGLFCRHLFTDKFATLGIGYKDIRIGGESELAWQNQQLYTNTITIPCYTEWQVYYPVELIDVINNLQITLDPEV
jgi:hypothetical protein